MKAVVFRRVRDIVLEDVEEPSLRTSTDAVIKIIASSICSDIFPSGYMGAEISDVKQGDLVAVFGCRPVGQMAIASAKILGAEKVFAVDVIPDRLGMAASQGAITINYDEVDPVKVLHNLTGGFGPDACIDAVGIDAQAAHQGPASKWNLLGSTAKHGFQKPISPMSIFFGDQWRPGDSPAQVLYWCVESVRKSGVIGIIGVYPETVNYFPIGKTMQKALTIRAANCSHRKYFPKLFEIIQETGFHPSSILTARAPFADVIACYKHFDKRESGWIKIELKAA